MTDFVKAMRARGWLAKEVADRWDMLPRQISRIGNAPRQYHWDLIQTLPRRKFKKMKRQRREK